MYHKNLVFQRCLLAPGDKPLTIHYYLLAGPSIKDRNKVVYGIQISSYSKNEFRTSSHSEEISHISYSKKETLTLLKRCYLHFVTPTDLYSSVDLLMNPVC